MFDVGEKVTVIADKGITYDGIILARATGDSGLGAYKIALDGGGTEQMGQLSRFREFGQRDEWKDCSSACH
jgi:hypothetical protein